MARTTECPLCASDLRGEPIPQEYIDAGYYSPGSTHYGRQIGYSAHDYTQFYICPDCGGTWNRWAPSDPYFNRAELLRAEYAKAAA